jgi:hypothetical protein
MGRVPNPSRSSFSVARSHRGWVMSDPEADETRLEMAHRHVREAEEHIARQEALIGRMELNGEDVLAAIGRTPLETLRQSLRAARDHAERLQDLQH